MRAHALNAIPGLRDIIGAWVVCFGIAAGCLTLLGSVAPETGFRSEALISPDSIATVASVDTIRADAHRPGRC